MDRSPRKLRADTAQIWWAGVRSVLPNRLIPDCVQSDGVTLSVGGETIDLTHVRRIVVVGAGKASAAMTVELERVLGPTLLAKKRIVGWVNVPADCLLETRAIHLHASRPPGVNEPRPEGVEGSRRMLELVGSLGSQDVCFCLLSGGGSALMPMPVPGVSLDDKIRLTRLLSAAGANIEQLNTVRSQLSAVKAGGLARACSAGRLVSIIISDVPGDRLETIACGPTVQSDSTPKDALNMLERLGIAANPAISGVVDFLSQAARAHSQPTAIRSQVTNLIIGNNAMAVDAAGCEAERLGYSHAMIGANKPEGAAEEVGRHLAQLARRMVHDPGPDCLISGGEPTVMLAEEAVRGRGGRNQQLALAALSKLSECRDIAILSAGTDGEDGPTDAAGAIVTAEVADRAKNLGLEPEEFLLRNDAYSFFEASGGLFKTGPTQTNVCDLRVVVCCPRAR